MEVSRLSTALLGGTGVVGQRLAELLARHPWFKLEAVYAGKTAGLKYQEVKWHSEPPAEVADLEVLRLEDFNGGYDVVFSALPSEVAGRAEEHAAEAGCAVFSNASSHRMDPDVPLVVPEVNPEHLELITAQRKLRGWSGLIATDPNCTTVGLVMALKPIASEYRIRAVRVATLQAASGAGYPGVPSLDLIDNAIPYIPGEEEKIAREARKILGELDGGRVKEADIRVEAACNRVPVLDGHLECVFIETEEPVSLDHVMDLLREFRGLPQELKLPTAPDQPIVVLEHQDRPQPRLDRGAGSPPGMSITVGRVRRGSSAASLLLTLLVHNTIRGAAGCALLLAELAAEMGWLS